MHHYGPFSFGDQAAYLWTKPADCWQRICVIFNTEASEGANDVDLNDLSKKFHTHVGQPNATEAFHIGAGANVVTVGNPHFMWDTRNNQWVRRQPVSGRAIS
eukprot:scaffold269616_cov42-Prasinocladus_malaysianus.AAC.2